MKKIDIGQTIQVLANLAVLGGIVFLGVEVQQNTRTVQAAAVQDSIEIGRQMLLLYGSDAETNRIVYVGGEDLSRLTPEEQQRYRWLLRAFLTGMQGLFRQWQLGVLPDEDWSVWSQTTCRTAATPSFLGLWDETKEGLTPAFIAYVESSCAVFRQ